MPTEKGCQAGTEIKQSAVVLDSASLQIKRKRLTSPQTSISMTVAAARKEKAALPRSTGASEAPGLSESLLAGDDDLDRCGVSGSGMLTVVWSAERAVGKGELRCSELREARSGEGEVVRAVGGGETGWIVCSSMFMARKVESSGRWSSRRKRTSFFPC